MGGDLDAAAVFCHVCGSKASASDHFCRSCGTKLRQ
jgi:rRNA maturation endonuclease Nob1